MDILNILALYYVIFLSVTYTNGGILSSQCKARCITENIHKKSSTIQAIDDCYGDVNCSSCIMPCSQEYKNQANCKFKCNEEPQKETCIETCEFLKLRHNSKIGTCPNPRDATGFAKTCLQTCGNDSECDGRKKCCFNGCGRTCQYPITYSEDIPSKPRNTIDVSEDVTTKEIILRWSTRKALSPTDIVYYVIQSKNNTGHHPSKNRMDTWYHVADTVEQHYRMIAKPGVFYEFQIASVNRNGTLGFNRPSDPFKLSVDPEPPNVPQNLREGESKLVNKTVSCRIYWDPPKESDLDILRYRVFWSVRLSSISAVYVSLDEHRRNVPANEHSYEIKGLLPNTKYFVQVLALAQWGSTRLKSERNSMYIVTMDTDQPSDQPAFSPIHPMNPYFELLPTPPPVRDMKNIDPPFWMNGTLNVKLEWRKPLGDDHGVNRYMLYWSPKHCLSNKPRTGKNATTHFGPRSRNPEATTHDLEFMLYGLIFDCRYEVIIHPVDTNFRKGAATTYYFQTPLCNEVIVKGKQKPPCPTPAPDVPSKPMDLSHRFSLGISLSLTLEWNKPSSKPEMVTGYRVTWGVRHLPSDTPFADRFERIKHSTAMVKNLPKVVKITHENNICGESKQGKLKLESETCCLLVEH
ncbi:anosmin-1-like [Anneissia japonica]|uniref:anosmin-1-like n=1 Tax=Anneissia japonica TaxID=1529436 RepID=UPI0014257B9E|nr:anosmin-1-like [Anneissia japonica]